MARVTKAITWLVETTRLVHATKVIRVYGAMQDNYTTTTLSVAQATPRRQAVHKTLSYHENLLRNWLRTSWGLGLHMYKYWLLECTMGYQLTDASSATKAACHVQGIRVLRVRVATVNLHRTVVDGQQPTGMYSSRCVLGLGSK